MDAVAREVKRRVGNAVARAYNYRPSVDPPACETCGGDGCEICHHTGDAQVMPRD